MPVSLAFLFFCFHSGHRSTHDLYAAALCAVTLSMIQGFGDLLVNHSVTLLCIAAQLVFYVRLKRNLSQHAVPAEIAKTARAKTVALISLCCAYFALGLLALLSNVRSPGASTGCDVLYGFATTSVCFWTTYVLLFLRLPAPRAHDDDSIRAPLLPECARGGGMTRRRAEERNEGSEGSEGFEGNEGNEGLRGSKGLRGLETRNGFERTEGFDGSKGPKGIETHNGFETSKEFENTEGSNGFQTNNHFENTQTTKASEGSEGSKGSQHTDGFSDGFSDGSSAHRGSALSICVFSLNCGSAPLSAAALRAALPPRRDVYLLSLQECAHPRAALRAIDAALNASGAYRLQHSALGGGLRALGLHGAILLVSLARRALCDPFASLAAASVLPTGWGCGRARLGNKGCAAAALRVNGATVLAMAAHFAADRRVGLRGGVDGRGAARSGGERRWRARRWRRWAPSGGDSRSGRRAACSST